MTLLIDVVLPIFLIVGFGYVAVWRGIISEGTVDALMSFAQKIAIPLLLFRAISTLDFSSGFQVPVLVGFYAGALICFCLGVSGAHFLFKRDWEDSIAVGFACLFSNSVLLGLPITERAYGPDNLTTNFAIIALHAPICYGVGITVMEVVKARGSSAERG